MFLNVYDISTWYFDIFDIGFVSLVSIFIGWILPKEVSFMGECRKGRRTCSNSFIWGLLDLAEVLAIHIGNQIKGIYCFFHFLFQNSCPWSAIIQAILSVTLTERDFLLGELFTNSIQTIFRQFALDFICRVSLTSKTVIPEFSSHYTPRNYRPAKQVLD